MEQAIFGQALGEYFRAKRVIPWLILAIVCGALAYSWQFLQPRSTPAAQYGAVSSMLVFRLVALASAIFTTAIVSQEVEQKTIVYLLTRPVPRWKLLVIRYFASVLVVAFVGVVAAFLTSYGAYKGFGGNPLLVKDMQALLMGSMAYGALFLFVSLLFNRSMIVCLLFAFGWETSVPNMRGMESLSIQGYMQAIAQHPSDETQNGILGAVTGGLGTNIITPDRAWAVLIGMVIVLLCVASWWFTHFEYIPREDAE
jgi:ABC-2 type transport system permease protein